MQPIKPAIRTILASVAVMMAFVLPAGAATYSWTGSASNLWSNQNNWSPVGVPGTADNLVFPSTAAVKSLTNDLSAATSFTTISLLGGNYTLSGNGIVLTSSLTSSSSGNVVNLPIDVQTNAVTIDDVDFQTLSINGSLSGSGLIAMHGILTLTGSHPYTGTLTGGNLLQLNGATLAAATISNQYILNGNGTTGPLTVRWLSVGPNDSAQGGSHGTSVLNTGSLTLNQEADFDLNGAVAGSGYDQINVTGTVTLNSSLIMTIGPSFEPSPNQQFVLINNDGNDAVAGSFRNPSTSASYAEGATIVASGRSFRLSYAGGDGNDVTLTALTSPKIWTGAVNNLWSQAGNWTGGVPVSGDSLQFPAGAGNLSNFNDLAIGTSFASISFLGGNYTLSGNGIVLTFLLTSSSSGNVMNLPIDVQTNAVTIDDTNLQTLSINGSLSGSGSIAMHGILTLTGSHPYTGTLTGGNLLQLNGATLAAATISNLYILNGNGTTGPLTVRRLSVGPNNSAQGGSNGTSVLNTGTLTLNEDMAFDLNGAAAGSGYDQINVTGTVTLSSSLKMTMGSSFVPTRTQTYVLINNDDTDPVTGAFWNASTGVVYAEGAILTLNGYQLQLSYAGGDGNDVTLTALTGKEPTTTTIESSLNPSDPGQLVTFTATVSTAGSPSGSVVFMDGPTTIGSGSISSHTATVTTSTLASGPHSITAQYMGDAGFAESTSSILTQIVRHATTTSISSLGAEVSCGSAVTYTATVSSSGGAPTGNVTFYEGATVLGTSALAGGSASYTTSSLSGGTHVITASYGGNAAFATSTSSGIATTVNIITGQPQSTSACANVGAVFSVAAANGSTFQWESSSDGVAWTPIGSATNASLTISATATTQYRVLVSSTCGSETSRSATLSITPATAISVQPSSTTTDVGAPAAFSVVAAGANLTYQWRKDAVNIPDATGPAYTIPSPLPVDAGSYDVVVTGSCGSVTSETVSLTVYASSPTIDGLVPDVGSRYGGQSVTIIGAGLTGAVVTVGGNDAIVTSTSSHAATFITPAHAPGVVDVTVTTAGGQATSANAFTYSPQGDANGDGIMSTADLVYLINYLFAGGVAPVDGDFNGDGRVDVGDVLDLIKDFFPETASATAALQGAGSASEPQAILRLASVQARGPLVSVPVSLKLSSTSPLGTSGAMGTGLQAVVFEIDVASAESIGEISVHRVGPLEHLRPLYEVTQQHGGRLFYLVVFDQATNPVIMTGETAIATIEVAIKGAMRHVDLTFNPVLTLLSNQEGTIGLTPLAGTLMLQDGSIGPEGSRRRAVAH